MSGILALVLIRNRNTWQAPIGVFLRTWKLPNLEEWQVDSVSRKRSSSGERYVIELRGASGSEAEFWYQSGLGMVTHASIGVVPVNLAGTKLPLNANNGDQLLHHYLGPQWNSTHEISWGPQETDLTTRTGVVRALAIGLNRRDGTKMLLHFQSSTGQLRPYEAFRSVN